MTNDDDTTDPLDPDDLKLPESHAKSLGDNRYVITADSDTPISVEEVSVPDEPSKAYEFALSLTVCGERSEATISTNNLGEAFEELLFTVTDAVAPDLPPDEALRILLAATNFER
ncbi:hypothetical protein [Haladaptatus sp. CMSO5]|uniref:hypothetical protein n=1 Tax=Haladaptatus sp. CMSO5 TaxID=3120514 RepID=UPI002FCE1FB5